MKLFNIIEFSSFAIVAMENWGKHCMEIKGFGLKFNSLTRISRRKRKIENFELVGVEENWKH